MWEELRWKVPSLYKWGGIYSQGWNWPLWLFDYLHDSLTSMTFWLYVTLCTTSGSLGLPCYITLIDNMAHSREVDDMTWHDSASTFVLLLECMSSCNAAGWWMSSWCITASPSHDKVHRVFNGRWFAWCCFDTFLLACMLESLTGSSVCERCMFIRLSVREHILHVRSFVRPRTHLCMIIHSRAHRMHRSFVRWWTYPSACAPFVHLIRRRTMFIGVLVPVVTYDETTSNPQTS